VNRLSSQGWGEEKAGRERIEERGEVVEKGGTPQSPLNSP